MTDTILPLSARGQLTIPQKIREQFPAKYFVCHVETEGILLKPLQTKEEFVAELDAAEQEWEKHGGKTLTHMKKKYKL